MAPRSFLLTDAQSAYLVDHCADPDDLQRRLIDETQAMGSLGELQIAPEQGAFLTLLARMVGASVALELGTFTGYSALCIARGLPPTGRLVCCDLSEEWTATARRYWRAAGVADRIDLRLGPAADTLRALPATAGFDLVFIDADKPAYPEYWELVVPHVRSGGVIVADNVLRRGEVLDETVTEEGTVAIRRFNDLVSADARVDSMILPVGDGMTLARRNDIDAGGRQ